MKTCSTLVLLSAAAIAIADAANCDFGAIQGKLFPNATDGLKKCASETGVDIWAIKAFPTEKQAQSIMTSRTCVDYLNQINERANREIQCDITIGDTTKGFGSLITDVLTGQTGNQTDSKNSTLDVEIPENAKAKPSPLLAGSGSSASASTIKKSATTPKASTTPTPSPTTSAAGASILSAAAAGALALVSVALQW